MVADQWRATIDKISGSPNDPHIECTKHFAEEIKQAELSWTRMPLIE